MSAVVPEVVPSGTGAAGWQHLPALDGLRAAAVVAVLLFHAGHLQGGFLGVDLFFALSGFLITSLLIRDASGGGIRLATFWGRRFRRLLPAVFALIVVVALWSWAYGSGADLAGVRRDGPWAVAYLANWHFIAESGGYWASFAQPSMFDHLWSLAIEEQFYLVWPLALAGVWAWSRRPERLLLVVCTAGVAASFVAMLVLYDGGDPTRVYMGLDTRAASLLVGAAAATAPVRRLAAGLVARLGRWTSAALAVLAALVVWSWVAVDGASAGVLYRGGLLLHSIACALLIVVLASAPDTTAARALGRRPLAAVGVLSYGLYLWHWPVYVALSPARTDLDGVTLTAVRIAVATLFALVSYRLVENPIRYRARWVRGRHGLPALAGAVAVVAVVLTVLPTPARQIAGFDPTSIDAAAPATAPRQGAPPTTSVPSSPATTTPASSVASSVASTTASSVAPRGPTTAGSTTAAPPSSARATTTTASPTTTTTTTVPPPVIGPALWAGDSIAYDLAPAVQASLGAAGVAIDVKAAYPGFRVGRGDEELALVTEVRSLLDAATAEVVILQLSVWDSELPAAEQMAGLTRMRDVAAEHGARVVFVGAPITGVEATNAGLVTLSAAARELSAADPAHVLFLDPSAIWGAEAVLDMDGDGTPERKPDLIHVCPSGAARFGAWLAGELSLHYAGVVPAPPTEWAAGAWVTDARYDQPVGACAPVG